MVCLAIILLVVNRISTFASTTKEKLKAKGYHVSAQGVAVQTQKRFNREDYVDATQRCVLCPVCRFVLHLKVQLCRGLVKAFGASSFGKGKNDGSRLDVSYGPLIEVAAPLTCPLQTPEPEHTVRKSRSGLLHRTDNKQD